MLSVFILLEIHLDFTQTESYRLYFSFTFRQTISLLQDLNQSIHQPRMICEANQCCGVNSVTDLRRFCSVSLDLN